MESIMLTPLFMPLLIRQGLPFLQQIDVRFFRFFDLGIL